MALEPNRFQCSRTSLNCCTDLTSCSRSIATSAVSVSDTVMLPSILGSFRAARQLSTTLAKSAAALLVSKYLGLCLVLPSKPAGRLTNGLLTPLCQQTLIFISHYSTRFTIFL